MKTTARKAVLLIIAAIIALTALATTTACSGQPENTNKNHNASLKKEDVEKYQGPQMVIIYTNDAYGFVEEFTIYDSHGKAYVYTNTTGHAKVKDEKDLVAGFIEKMEEEGTDVSGSKKYKTEQTINNAWLEAIQADFNADKTDRVKNDDEFGCKDYYVFDTNGKAHWIMREGAEEYQLKDEHVSAAKGALIGD